MHSIATNPVKMRKPVILLLFCVLMCSAMNAQQSSGSVKGVITDTLNKQNLQKAVVSILRAKDSVLVKFARTDAQGQFEIKDLPPGKFVVLTSFPNYADYTDVITMENQPVDLGKIPMITKAHLLQEVIVKQTVGSIKMKGDTTEYKADSFHVQANASVEELLKKLPGIQVDKNGQITAQGQKVQKVLVDGEEFFGDDPTLVTQNIRADMVDKVQVFDKKSEQAAFTGIDDGEKSKTINLKLKDDKKKGYFGKLDAGVATNSFYNAQGMFNKFRKKEKMSFYGIFSNTGKTGLNWQDQRSYGDNSSNIQFDDGGNGFMVFGSGGNDDLEGWGGNYNGQGYPKVQTGGAHYNNKFGDDKQSINGNYKILDLSVNGQSNTNTQYILPDTVYYTTQKQLFNNKITRNKGSVVYDYDVDSTSTLKIMADASSDHKITLNDYTTQSLSQDSALVNDGHRLISTDGVNSAFNSSLLWRKKLKKKGRTISISGKENYTNNTSSGFLNSTNHFYQNGAVTGTTVTDQYKTTESKLLAFDAKATYTEPLSSAASLILNYEMIVNNSSSTRNSFNKSSAGKYEVLDTVYSNDYIFNTLTQKGGASFSFVKKKYSFSVGNTMGYTDFTQKDVRSDISGSRNFINWYPNAYINYAFTNQRRLYLNYNGSTQQPTLQQIQPLRTNDDPLNIIVGNPSLKPSFRNNINVNFNDFKALSGRSIFFGLSYSATDNAFASRDSVDYTSGKRVSQAINVNGNNSMNVYLDYGFKLFGANVGFNGNINNAHYVNVVNNLPNTTYSQSYNIGAYAGKSVDKIYDNSISANAAYTTSTSSVQSNVLIHYWTYNIRPDLDFFFPWKLQLHTDCDFIFRQKTSAFDNDSRVVFWNAWFGKKLLAGDALVIKISANDILNQNVGFSRTANTNYITQNTYTTIQRYFMISAVWNFTKGAKPAGNN